ncbi:MAG: GerMN domain-containing protein [Eubacterium sp.]|nr:GerMN domain-containing protein [Eubacterium sp.]
MKKIISLILSLSLLLCLTACGQEGTKANEYKIYYLDTESSRLVEEKYTTSQDRQDIISVIKDLIGQINNPKNDKVLSPIDDGIEIIDYQIKENQLSLYFSAGYNNKSGVDEILSRAAIVKTLCQLKEIQYVDFYVEDQPLVLSGNTVGLMSDNSFVDELNPSDATTTKEVALYFATVDGKSLQEVRKEISYNAAEPLAKLLVETLILGPNHLDNVNIKSRQTIPEDTVLNTVTIRDNVCYLDLSREFKNQIQGLQASVTVYSIVNTLCELSNINMVQFTVEGEQEEYYGDLEGFNMPLERNLDLVIN